MELSCETLIVWYICFRFVFVTPPVQSERIRMHVSHPPPSYLRETSYRESLLRMELSPKTSNYHKIMTKMTVQFPELRLIQYDCGMYIFSVDWEKDFLLCVFEKRISWFVYTVLFYESVKLVGLLSLLFRPSRCPGF
jgi:hypothetical protein